MNNTHTNYDKREQHIAELERELQQANAILDWLADERIFDGINGVDIDDATFDAYTGDPDDEEAWKLEWRKQFRIAIMKGFKS